MKLVISSFEGVGAIEFGMKISDVRMLMGKNYKTFKRNVDDSFPCDYFEAKGLFVYYKLPGVVDAIEIVLPALPELDSYSLLEAEFNEAVLFLQKYDNDLELEEGPVFLIRLVLVFMPMMIME
ncbi:hypothetical protein ACU8V3_14205 [Cobetia marina]